MGPSKKKSSSFYGYVGPKYSLRSTPEKKTNIIPYGRSIAALWFLPKNFVKKISTSKTLE